MVRGEGLYLIDAEGRRYLDAVSSWWACNLGHSHPRLVQAITRQAAELQHSILGNLTHPRALELAEQLAQRCGGRRRVFFSSDGASAVEAALKIAVQSWHNRGRPEKSGLVSLENGYHGDTLGAVSVGYLPGFHKPFQALLFPVHRVPAPFCARCPWQSQADSCALACLKPMRDVFETEADHLAAIILEPLCQGAAGMRIYQPDYLRGVAELCRKHDILLILDEVAMGFGRTGRMFAYAHAGIDPDILCLGKGLSGGYLPLSATVVKEMIYDTFADQPVDHTFYHGHTFAGNPIAAAAALAMLKVYDEEEIVAQAEQRGRRLEREMQRVQGLPGVSALRGLGMIAAFDLYEHGGRTGAARAQAVRDRLLAQGILIRPLGQVVYLMPPLITPDDVLAQLAHELCQAVQNV